MLPSNSHKSKTPSYVLYMTMVPKVDKMQYWEKFYGKFNLSKPTGHMMQQQFNVQQLYSAHTVFMCFVFIWEQTPTCATYSINWLVFLTEMKSVYCAVRTGSLNKAVCCIYLRTNSDLCHLQHKLIGFSNRDEKCLLRGTNRVFK